MPFALGFAENLLYLLTDRHGDTAARAMARVLDVSLILYAEHEFNASTFAARVAASTLTDLHAAITAAIASLKGPLHGGANEAVASMLLEIKSRDRAEQWVREALASKRRVMGFGHRVLRKGDSRSRIIQRHAEVLSRTCRDTRWYEIATTVDGATDSDNNDFVAQEGSVTGSLGSELRGTLRAGWRHATDPGRRGTSYGGGGGGGYGGGGGGGGGRRRY